MKLALRRERSLSLLCRTGSIPCFFEHRTTRFPGDDGYISSRIDWRRRGRINKRNSLEGSDGKERGEERSREEKEEGDTN